LTFGVGIFGELSAFHVDFVLDELVLSARRDELPGGHGERPASRPATPASRTVPGPGFAPATPRINEMLVRSPSPAPSTAARPALPCTSRWRVRRVPAPNKVSNGFCRPPDA
jgi:hypothetical protein